MEEKVRQTSADVRSKERKHHHHHEHHHHEHHHDKVKEQDVNEENEVQQENDCEEKSCSCKHGHHRHGHHSHGGHSHSHGGHSHSHGGHSHGCHCHSHHEQDDDDEPSMTKRIITIVVAAVLLVAAYMVERKCSLPTWQLLLVYLVPYLVVGHHTIKEAIEGIVNGDPFNENFLMTIATMGALAIGFMPGAETEFPEAVFVMLFFQIGEMMEGYAEGRSRKSISHLMDIRPDTANIIEDGNVTTVSPDKVSVGSTILVRPGEKVPLDGTIIDGVSSLNTVALTGESMPREVGPGSEVVSGCINLNGVITMTTTKTFGESTVSKIIDLVENAAQHKSQSEDFISRFAHVYTPIVVVLAIALAFVPPYFAESYFDTLPLWLHRALVFLVVSCPCALVISVPLTFFGGIGGASRKGILIKGANFIDKLAEVDTVVFDKTGTLTNGTFTVTEVNAINCDEKELIHLAAIAERHSTHPIAVALRNADNNDNDKASDYEEIAGHGIKANFNGKVISVGNVSMMEQAGVACEESSAIGTVVYVARDSEYLGYIVINDTIKEDSFTAITALKKIGIRKNIMFTGDRDEAATDVAQQLSLDDYYFELLPQDKVKYLLKLIRRKNRRDEEKMLAFVGDGINDAPVLARADVGIAMGAMGSDAAIEAADVVLMNDTPSSIATAIKIARRTIRIARENVVLAIGIKVAVLILAAFGLSTMGMAVFADVGVTVLAVLNAMRALRA